MLPMRTHTNGGTNRVAGLTTAGSPLALIDEMRREMDRVFDQMLGGWADPRPSRLGALTGALADTWVPTMDVQETEKELRLTVEVPGLGEDDLHLDVTDDVLTISGEKKVARDETEGVHRLLERRAGRFERRVTPRVPWRRGAQPLLIGARGESAPRRAPRPASSARAAPRTSIVPSHGMGGALPPATPPAGGAQH